VRGGMGERHSGSKYERRDPGPIEVAQVAGRHARARRLCDGVSIVIPADHVGTAGKQRARARESRSPEPEERNFFPGKCRDWNQAIPAFKPRAKSEL
jgi:hypothetical protein